MRTLALSLFLALLSLTASAADLATGTYFTSDRVDPGQLLYVSGSIVNQSDSGTVVTPRLRITFSSDLAFVAVTFPPGEVRWACTNAPGVVECVHSNLGPRDQDWYQLSLRAPDSRFGGLYKISIEATSPSPDERTDNNRFEVTSAVTHVIPVTHANDDGAESFRAAILEANASCDGSLPCSIRPRPVGGDELRLVTPLPAITGCVEINGFPDTMTLDGSALASGDGLELRADCRDDVRQQISNLTLQNFPRNGLAISSPRGQYSIDGVTAKNNGLRGLNADSPFSLIRITRSRFEANHASGVGLWSTNEADISFCTISGNGASGIFVAPLARWAYLWDSTVSNNRHFGVAIARGAHFVPTNSVSMTGNGNLDIDWNLDGVTPNDDESDHIPNAPAVLSARYDAASNKTLVTVELSSRSTDDGRYFEVLVWIGKRLTPFGTAEMERSPAFPQVAFESQFEVGQTFTKQLTFTLDGDLRGQYVSAQTIARSFPPPPEWTSAPRTNASELSAGLRVE